MHAKPSCDWLLYDYVSKFIYIYFAVHLASTYLTSIYLTYLWTASIWLTSISLPVNHRNSNTTMSTCLADSSSDGCYTSIAMSKSSSSSSNASISTSPTESSPTESSATEGLENVKIHQYAGIQNMQ